MSAHANSVKEWKDKAREYEAQRNEAIAAVQSLERMLQARDQRVAMLEHQLNMLSTQMPLSEIDDDDDVEPIGDVPPDLRMVPTDSEEGRSALESMFGDLEVEIEAEGFKTEGVDSSGNPT